MNNPSSKLKFKPFNKPSRGNSVNPTTTSLTTIKTHKYPLPMEQKTPYSPNINKNSKLINTQFKDIKYQINNIKHQINHYFGDTMTNSCRKLQLSTFSHNKPSFLYKSDINPNFTLENHSVLSSSESERSNLYAIKFKIASEELQALKRKYQLRKVQHKQTIIKLCKKIGSLEQIVKDQQQDLQQHKIMLKTEINSIKEQMSHCLLNQMTNSTFIDTLGEEKAMEHFYLPQKNKTDNNGILGSILNPECDSSNQIFQLKQILDKKECVILQLRQKLEKLRFQNLQLQDLLDIYEKKQLIVISLNKECDEYRNALEQKGKQLQIQRQACQNMRKQLEQFFRSREVQYVEHLDKQNYLREELQYCLIRESNLQLEFRKINEDRKQISQKQLQKLKLIIIQNQTQLRESKILLQFKQQKIEQLNRKINRFLTFADFENTKLIQNYEKQDSVTKQISDKSTNSTISQKYYEGERLKQQCIKLENQLKQSVGMVQLMKNNYEQQLYKMEIQQRKKSMYFEDKLKDFMNMVAAEVSDVVLREQDFQLLEKQQEVQKTSHNLVEANMKICLLQGQIEALKQKQLVNNVFYPPNNQQDKCFLMLQNDYYRQIMGNLVKKIEVLTQINHKTKYIIQSKIQFLSDDQKVQILLKTAFGVPNNLIEKIALQEIQIKRFDGIRRQLSIQQSKDNNINQCSQ